MSSKLVFINTSGPEDSKSSDKRKAVRSQAAKDHSQSSSGRTEGTSRRRHRKLLSVELELDVYESETSGSGSTPTKTGSTSTAQEAPSNLNSIQRRPHGGKPDPIVGSSKMPGAGGTRPSVPSTLSHRELSLLLRAVACRYPKG